MRDCIRSGEQQEWIRPVTTQGHEDRWPLRPAWTGAVGIIAGIIINALMSRANAAGVGVHPSPVWIAGTNAVIAAAGLFALTLERRAVLPSVALAALGGLTTGLLLWWDPSAVESWRLLSWYLALGLAAVLFHVARDAGALRFAYEPVYRYAWRGVLTTLAGLAFAALVFALAYLIVSLFELVGVASTRAAFDDQLLFVLLAGGGFGAGLG